MKGRHEGCKESNKAMNGITKREERHALAYLDENMLEAARAGPCGEDTEARRVDGAVRRDEGEVHAREELKLNRVKECS